MPTTVQGTRSTASILQDRQVIDISKEIYLLDPSSYPLTTILNGIGQVEPCHNITVRWMEDEQEPWTDLVNGGVAANIGAITVDNGGWWRVSDIMHIPRTGENCRVTAIAGNVLTVTRSFGIVAAALIVDDEPVYNLGPAQRQGDTSRTLLSTLEVEETNQTQIIRMPFGNTNTAEATELYDGSDFEYQAKKAAIAHAINIEKFCIFGQDAAATVANTPLRTMRGIQQFIRTNRINIAGVLTESDLDAACEVAFRYAGTDQMMAIASGRVIQAINNFSKTKMQTVNDATTYGCDLHEYISPFGRLMIAYHKLLMGTVYSGYMFILQPDLIKLRVLRGAATGGILAVRKTNIQANDEDSRRDEYLSELTLEFRNEKAHAVLTGITG